jgi:AcrR family transcriptional regulator
MLWRMGPTGTTDGRSARGERTREAVLEALVELVEAGEPNPSAPRIAEQAGISVRSIYVHFASLEDLRLALVERVTLMVIERLAVIDPHQPTEVKADLLCGQRARINEDLGSLLLAAERQEHDAPEFAKSRAFGRQSSRAQIERVFAAELEALDPAARTRRVAAVDALIGLHSWRLLRTAHGLTPDEARLATREGVQQLLRAQERGERTVR